VSDPQKKSGLGPEMRILVASLLSMAVILLWTRFFAPKPTVLPQQANHASAIPAPRATSVAPTAGSGGSALGKAQAAVPAVKLAAKSESQERTLAVENDLYRIEFSNHGAVVKSWQLKKYQDDSKPRRILDLVHPEAAQQTGGWPMAVVLNDPDLEAAANNGLYQVSSPAANLTAPGDVEFSWSDGHLEVTKSFHFDRSYVVRVETSAKVNGAPVPAGLAWLGGFGDLTVTNPVPSETVSTYYTEHGKLTDLAHKKLEGLDKWGPGVWRERLDRNRRPVFYGGISTGKRAGAGDAGDALLGGVSNGAPAGRKRNTRAGGPSGHSLGGATHGFAHLCRPERLRRFEEDESAAAGAGEFRVVGIYRRPAVSRAEMAA